MSLTPPSVSHLPPPQLYAELANTITHLCQDEPDALANLANTAALLYHSLAQVNWVGFYLFKNNELVVGPFQGKPACVHIALGKGVCGTAALQRQTIVVANVHEFSGHIACDSASQSEIVIPLIQDANLVGVLDIDSPILARFTPVDATGLERCMHTLLSHTRVSELLPKG
jgi:L-methionine (R)-S-oxide reductase